MADSPPQPASRPPRPTKHRRARRRRRTWPQRLLITGSSLMAVVCLVAAFGVWYANHRLQDLERVVITHASAVTVAGSGPSDTAAPATAVDEAPGNAQNFLLIGSDARREACTAADSPFAGGLGNVTSELSDTIILVRIDPAAGQAAILSFPRDLWVTIAGTGRKGKINSAYQPDNPSRLVQTIEEGFGVFIDHTVQVSLCAFKSLVDSVGGVNVPFAYPTKDEETGLDIATPGCVTLNGDEALAYVRSRAHYQYFDGKSWKFDGTSDYGRIARQQDFIQRALQKAVDKGARNLGVARDLLDVALANVVVDQNLTISDLLRLASTLRDFDPAQLRAHSYRVEGRGATQGGQDIIIPDTEAPTTKAILEVFRGHARLSDVAPADASPPTTTAGTGTTAASDTTAGPTTASRSDTTAGPTTTTSPTTTAARPTTTAGGTPKAGSTTTAGGATTAPAPTALTTPGATTTVPVVDVAPNPLGISPPDDPTCR
jgi:LCP family protein required for cell wall assembly